MLTKLIIGSRKSRLALFQSNFIKGLIEKSFPSLQVSIHPIITTGDKILDKPLSKIGDKGLFTKEIEDALLSEEIDLAVHSLKDLQTELPKGLTISAYTTREEYRDALVSKNSIPLIKLPNEAIVGTSSLRRKSQLLKLRPDLKIVDLRGNVETRVKKLKIENLDAIVLAAAGLIRLNMQNEITELLPPEIMLSAVGQGIIAIESTESRKDLCDILTKVNDPTSEFMAIAERAVLRTFGGGCQVPVGALAEIDGDSIIINAFVGSVDGRDFIKHSITGKKQEAQILGETLANEMLEKGAAKIIEGVRNEC